MIGLSELVLYVVESLLAVVIGYWSYVLGGFLLRPELFLEIPDVSRGTMLTRELLLKNRGKSHASDIFGFIRYFKEGKRCFTYEILGFRTLSSIGAGETKEITFSFYRNFYEFDKMEIMLFYGSYPLGIQYSKTFTYDICTPSKGNIHKTNQPIKTKIVFRRTKFLRKLLDEITLEQFDGRA